MPIKILSLILVCAFHLHAFGNEPYFPAMQVQLQTEPYLPAFEPLAEQEMQTDWGKEMKIGLEFAKEEDFYRAITGFKRALFLLPDLQWQRRMDLEYGVVLSYYHGEKWESAIEAFQESSLPSMPTHSPLYRDALIVLYDCYQKVENEQVAGELLSVLKPIDSNAAAKLEFGSALFQGSLEEAKSLEMAPDYYEYALYEWKQACKSPKKAGLLNALLPGAGYWYVGQKGTALTAALLNSLFIAASYQFFHHGATAAGIITSSFELGWYLGGIFGSVRAAETYNRSLFESMTDKIATQERLFPVLMLNYSF